MFGLGPHVQAAVEVFRKDINLVLARGVRRLFAIAQDEYRRTLDKHGVLDFPDLLERTLKLLGQMEEFSRSRYRLESRYEHVLVDEFQDTSRAQWRLVRELVRAWAAGEGLSHGPIPPSIFIVGDRKQSIYGFRDAEVTVLDAAAQFVDALRPETPARAAITRSYRSVHELLMFVNDVCVAIDKADRPDAFRYTEDDAFPVIEEAPREADAIGVITADSDRAQAEAVAGEIARLLQERATIRDRHTGVRRPIGPGDIGVLFRTRESHALFEAALAKRGVPYYVYKGLGFFDAEEIKDVLALVSYLADPFSNLQRRRVAALTHRPHFRRRAEAPCAATLSGAITGECRPRPITSPPTIASGCGWSAKQRATWIDLADQWPAAELIDRVLAESAYAVEIAGPGFAQARENLKKIRGLIRRIQNRGYATLGRLSDYFAGLVAGGDESNAIIDAADAVNLMTVHAAKGLEFPVVFIVNIGKGSGGNRDDVRVAAAPFAGDEDEDGRRAAGDGQRSRERERSRRRKGAGGNQTAAVRGADAGARSPVSGRHPDGRQARPAARIARPGAAASSSDADGGPGRGAVGQVLWQGASGAHALRRIPRTRSGERPYLPSAGANCIAYALWHPIQFCRFKEPHLVGLTCPNCGNARNFLVKTLQMHVVQLDDTRVEVSEESKPGVIEVLCDECETALNFDEAEEAIRKEVLLTLGAR